MDSFYKSFKIFLLSSFLSTLLYSENIDDLLNEFNQKNDTSQKTIDENKGHLVLYTRDRIERMHARTLKDILETTPVIYYHENRYAIPDPLAGGSGIPYVSNLIRVYIDGVEVTQGWLGSGLMLYGDINIDFVDHIEFYYMTPSFETSTEPAYMTIFLYSKQPDQDSGAKLSLLQGDNGYNAQSFSYGAEKEDYSYMINISHTDAIRDKIDNGTDTPLSRDYQRTQIFGYIKNDNQIFHLQLINKETDSLAGLSWDATPELSEVDYLNLHMDYGITFNEYWHAQFTYEWLKTNIRYKDDTPLISAGIPIALTSFTNESKNDTFTAELTHKTTIGKHHFITGVKARRKKLIYANTDEAPSLGKEPFDTEVVSSIFFQDQYKYNENNLFSLGVSYNHIDRNGDIGNNDLWQFRVGYIYANDQWSYKTYLYRSMFAKDPLGTSLYNLDNLTPQTSLGFTQEAAYKDNDQSVRLILHIMKDENGLLNNDPSIETKYFSTILNYNYILTNNSKLDLQLYYAHYTDIFNVDKLQDWSGYLALSNTYKHFDFYNSVIWHRNSIDYKDYFDLSSTITWNLNENLSVSLKGENLLNKAKKTQQYRVDPITMTPLSPIDFSTSNRRIKLEVEYIF